MRIFFIPLQQNKSNKTENFPTSKPKKLSKKKNFTELKNTKVFQNKKLTR